MQRTMVFSGKSPNDGKGEKGNWIDTVAAVI